jgi:hypothetical protein
VSLGEHNATPLPGIAVLNPDGRDREQTFPDGAGNPDDPRSPHPPINYHAYAACTGGSFHVSTAAALATGRPVLLLLRRNLRDGWRALQQLQAAGRTVAVTFKEAGALQVAARLTNPGDIEMLARIARAADGCLAPTPWLYAFFKGIRGATEDSVHFIPTPYPVDDPRWDFSAPMETRRGIFIGTREWDTPSRQHLAALWAACRLHARTGERISVVNTEGRAGIKRLRALGFSMEPAAALRIIPGPLPYTGYLREMASHKIVFQLDRSGVPGQVAGDALLCRVPCVGGDGAVEQIAFPELSGHGHSPDELAETAERLLGNPSLREQATHEAQARALNQLSFREVSGKLHEFFY